MKGNIRSWKAEAKKTLRGKYGTAIFAMIMVNALSMLGSELGYSLFSGSSILDLIASNVVAFIVTLIVCIFSAGLSYMYLNMARGKEYSYGNLIYFFKNHPDRIIVASFVLALISLLVSLPGFFIGDMGTTLEELVVWSYKYLGTTLFAVVANMLLTLPLTQVYYLMADDLELEGFASLKKSIALMKGNIGKYLLLQISFLPWFLLSFALMAVGLFVPTLVFATLVGAGLVFWVIPYMEMSAVFFYRDLIGDYGIHRDDNLAMYNGYMGNMFTNNTEYNDTERYDDKAEANTVAEANNMAECNDAAESNNAAENNDAAENKNPVEYGNMADHSERHDDYNAEA